VETYTAGDGYRWHYRHYAAAGMPRGWVVCLHGIQSHGGWYTHSCQRLADAGFTVDFLDRRGSGLNQQDRGDTPGFRRLLDDVAEFLRAGGDAGPPPRPCFLIGISWGGKLAVALQRRHPGLVDGLALLCPGFSARVRPPLRQRLAILWARLVAPRRLFPIPLNDPELFTATPHWQRFIADDPLGLRAATARLFIESLRLDGYLHVVPRHVGVPVLLLLAEHDRIIDNRRTRRYVERFASTDKETIEYPGAHHTLEFEPEPERFIADVRRWLEQHSPASACQQGVSAPEGGRT
jgi:alpha-beta hydrolase superfamily lysophospholipase